MYVHKQTRIIIFSLVWFVFRVNGGKVRAMCGWSSGWELGRGNLTIYFFPHSHYAGNIPGPNNLCPAELCISVGDGIYD